MAVDQQPTPLGRLEPIFSIDGVAHSLRTAELAAVPQSLLNFAPVQEESARDYDIRRALDLLFTGI